MFRTRRFSKSQVNKIKKVKMLEFKEEPMEYGRDGVLFILIKLQRNQLLDLTKSSASISTDHSFSNRNFQCIDFWKLLVPETL